MSKTDVRGNPHLMPERLDRLEEAVAEINLRLGIVESTPQPHVQPPQPPAPHELYVPGEA